ncbi:MAG: class I SAM-dependent methyltransferase, partial [Proteobacteria bacterium]|nr:class I SAM-dependent methyltransferase [Pseudomonadota bacterium]
MYARLIPSTLRRVMEHSPSVFQALVDYYFSKMTEGRLVIKDETSGREFCFGQGKELSARIRVKDPAFFRKLVLATDIGLGESYVDGDWDTDDVGAVIRWFIINLEKMPSMSGGQSPRNVLVNAMAQFNKLQHSLNQNTLQGSKKNISNHYDLGNEFFQSFLDSTMTYSSALFSGLSDEDLATAQINKLRNMAEMGGVKPHHKVLEIGTGWGEFSCFLAETYGCHV